MITIQNTKAIGEVRTNRSVHIAMLIGCIMTIVISNSVSAHGSIDRVLGAASACRADSDSEQNVFRQDHLLIATNITEVDCQIPNEVGKKLRRVFVRMSNINGLNDLVDMCQVESWQPFSRTSNNGSLVLVPNGNTNAYLSLSLPERASRTGYWTINCTLGEGTVLEGVRYRYR